MSVDSLIVERLWQFYDGWFDPWEVGFKMEMIGQGDWVQSEPFRPPDDLWDAERHAARIRYLVSNPQFLEDPVEIDNVCDGGHIYAEPVILDGHHRLAAHVWLGMERINATYGGRCDFLEYLKGNLEECPE